MVRVEWTAQVSGSQQGFWSRHNLNSTLPPKIGVHRVYKYIIDVYQNFWMYINHYAVIWFQV